MAFLRNRKLALPLAAFLVVAAAWLLWPMQAEVAAADEDAAATPKLVVLVVFDQMRGDYLSRWEELLTIAMGVPAPRGAEAPVPAGLFRK
jgi:hypothetical protein